MIASLHMIQSFWIGKDDLSESVLHSASELGCYRCLVQEFVWLAQEDTLRL